MKVLIACEYSGIVRDAFIAHGHDAMSCDLLPTESPGPHVVGDVTELLSEPWDLVIAHPPCTFLANSGVRWLHNRPYRWFDLWDGAEFFRLMLNANANHIAVENPRPHKYAVRMIGRTYDQEVQPWQFGQGETKGVCLWLKNLPELLPTEVVSGREARVHKMPPGPDRQKERSRFFPGIAQAMAHQWGLFISNHSRRAGMGGGG